MSDVEKTCLTAPESRRRKSVPWFQLSPASRLSGNRLSNVDEVSNVSQRGSDIPDESVLHELSEMGATAGPPNQVDLEHSMEISNDVDGDELEQRLQDNDEICKPEYVCPEKGESQ